MSTRHNMDIVRSKYCSLLQCPKRLWLDINKPDEKVYLNDSSAFIENSQKVGILGKNYFIRHHDVKFNKNYDVMINDTIKLLERKRVVISNASFKYKKYNCTIDALKKNNDNYIIYLIKGSSKVHDNYYNDAAYQYYILTKLGFNIQKCIIIHLNRNYERIGDLNLKELFIELDITETVLERIEKVGDNLKLLKEIIDSKEEPSYDLDNYCFTPYDCPYFTYCSKNLVKPNIFDINGMQQNKKINLYKEGIIEYKDLLESNIDDKVRKQLEYELENKEDYINKDNIKEFLNKIKEPIYFLDFESYQVPIPPYDHIKPFSQIVFQYSLHYIENDKLCHKEFLAESGIDPRRGVAENLVKDIKEECTIIAYNDAFEKTRIKELANLYPEYSDKLMKLYENFIDLSIPFMNGDYYSKNMKGKFSIKYVLPSLFPNDPSLDYHNLELIHNGIEANSYFQLLKNKSKEEQDYIRERLLRYCELDTYAMVKIYNKLKELVK